MKVMYSVYLYKYWIFLHVKQYTILVINFNLIMVLAALGEENGKIPHIKACLGPKSYKK